MKNLTITDKIAYLFLLIIYAIGIYIANTDIQYFDEVYTVEDGYIEALTSLYLGISSFILFSRFFKLQKNKAFLWKIGMIGLAVIFFFGAGEEISWGQRIFNVESSEYFLQNNAQGETNLHNMVVDGKKVNKIIFSQLLTAVLIIYLLITPFLYRKIEWFSNLADSFAVPIVKWHHTISFLVGTGLLAFISSDRKWEIYELAFSLIFLLIFLNPLNKNIYSKS